MVFYRLAIKFQKQRYNHHPSNNFTTGIALFKTDVVDSNRCLIF